MHADAIQISKYFLKRIILLTCINMRLLAKNLYKKNPERTQDLKLIL
mgnify:CR=1 FL=1